MSLFNSIKGLFSPSTSDKKKSTPISEEKTAERLTSPLNDSLKRLTVPYEEPARIKNSSNRKSILQPTKTTPSPAKLSVATAAAKAGSSSSHLPSRYASTPISSQSKTNVPKPIFTSYSSPFCAVESDLTKFIPKPQTTFSTPSSRTKSSMSSTPVSSRTTMTSLGKPLIGYSISSLRDSTKPASDLSRRLMGGNSISTSSAARVNALNENSKALDSLQKSKAVSSVKAAQSGSATSKKSRKVKDASPIVASSSLNNSKLVGTRQEKRNVLIDTSLSRASPIVDISKTASGLSFIKKKKSTSKIHPMNPFPNQMSKLTITPISNNRGKQTLLKPATVSKAISSPFSSTKSSAALTTNIVPVAPFTSKKRRRGKRAAAASTVTETPAVKFNSVLVNQKKADKKKITPLLGRVQSYPQISNKQKKKKVWAETKQSNKVARNGRNFYQNKTTGSGNAFVLPEEILSVDNYYKSCNLTCKNGVYYDPNGDENEFLMGCLIFDENEDITGDGPARRKAEKVLPKIYEKLLNDVRANNKQLNEKLLKRSPYDTQIVPKLKQRIFTVEDAGKKFEVFNYLQLIEEFLESDEPVAEGATVTLGDITSKKIKKLLNTNQPSSSNAVDKEKPQNVMIIKVPFVKDIEEKVRFMAFIYLIPDKDVRSNQPSTTVMKVKVAKIVLSENKGPTTIVAIYDDKELEKMGNKRNFNGITFSIFAIPNVMVANSVMQSVKVITKNQELSDKVLPPYRAKANEIQKFRQQMSENLDSLFYNSSKSFNQKQKEAIYAMTRPVNTTFLLFGPPGTGKTYTLVETIRQLLCQKSKKPSTNRTILICTPSNMAADAIAEGIIDGNFLKPSEIFRVVSASRDVFKRNTKLDCITQRKVLRDTNNEEICTVYDLPLTRVLEEFKIIICTLGSTPRLAQFLDPGHFSHIFVDEAAQAPEMDVWLAVGLFAEPETRLILAGDPKQLGPVTTIDVLSKNESYGYKKSLLARLVDKNIFNKDPRYLIQLTDNHRSHQGIVRISSELFYENSLVSTNPAGHDSLCALPFLRKPNFPVLFHSVTSGGEETSETRSRRNLAEVDIIVQYVNKCLRYVKAKDIGVVSPYKYQAESIRQRLNNREITVETVEKYQGSERRVIIISTVRTKELGFMACNLRFNTAITRAKHLLIVVGNNKALSTQKSWKRFIEYCQQNGSLVKDFRNNLKSIEQSLANLKI